MLRRISSLIRMVLWRQNPRIAWLAIGRGNFAVLPQVSPSSTPASLTIVGERACSFGYRFSLSLATWELLPTWSFEVAQRRVGRRTFTLSEPGEKKKLQGSRWTAALLLALLCSSFVAPFTVSASDLEATLPICCRAHGKHQCGLMIMQPDAPKHEEAPAFARVSAKCPYVPASPLSAHADRFRPIDRPLIYAEISAHPSNRPQVQAMRRVAFDRSRQKRGPPAHLLPPE